MVRKLIIHPKVRDRIRSFPKDVRIKLGQALFDLQNGERLAMPQSRPMPAVAMGVEELRTRGEDGIYRVFYCTKYKRGILVFHAFVKKTTKTPLLEIELAKKRLKELLDEKS